MACWSKFRYLFLAVVVIAAGCGNQTHSDQPIPAPPFTLKDLSGKAVSLSDYKGKLILLDFWATWCGPCIVSIPMVQDLYERYKEHGFMVLGLNMNEDPSVVFPFVKRMKMTYPILYAGFSSTAMQYGMEGLPLFILVDPEGNVRMRYDGFSPGVIRAIENEILKTLPDPAAKI